MGSEEISKYGIYFDDIYTLRVLEPEVANETNDLTDECSGYMESMRGYGIINGRNILIRFSC